MCIWTESLRLDWDISPGCPPLSGAGGSWGLRALHGWPSACVRCRRVWTRAPQTWQPRPHPGSSPPAARPCPCSWSVQCPGDHTFTWSFYFMCLAMKPHKKDTYMCLKVQSKCCMIPDQQRIHPRPHQRSHSPCTPASWGRRWGCPESPSASWVSGGWGKRRCRTWCQQCGYFMNVSALWILGQGLNIYFYCHQIHTLLSPILTSQSWCR